MSIFTFLIFIDYIFIGVFTVLAVSIPVLVSSIYIINLIIIIIDIERMDLIFEELIFMDAQEAKFDILSYRKYYEIKFLNRKKLMKTTEMINLKPQTLMNISYLRRSNIIINASLNE